MDVGRRFWRCGSVMVMGVLAAVLLIAPPGRSHGQATPSPTPTPDAMQSIFAADTCAPPCWFGLVPGESTAEEVEVFGRSFEDRLTDWQTSPSGPRDAETGHLVNGGFYFHWRDYRRPDRCQAYSSLILREGILYYAHIIMNEYITLEQALDVLRQPDIIRFIIGPHGIPYVDLVYTEPRLEVTLRADRNQCTVQNIGEVFWVTDIDYYSPNAFEELGVLESKQEIGIYDVPSETWDAWWSGAVDMACYEAEQQLAEVTGVPAVLPMLTPTPESP